LSRISFETERANSIARANPIAPTVYVHRFHSLSQHASGISLKQCTFVY
jgi:hypothetical protein